MSYFNLNVHIVFSTKDRRPWLRGEAGERLVKYMGGIIRELGGRMLAAGISAALFARERSGEGQFVSTSLLRQGIYMLSFDMAITLGIVLFVLAFGITAILTVVQQRRRRR